ncbi:hypothetical protein UZ36_02470 [Candidatus Nitromaritima sp. SCGC AAA799-C22]|nr:hypothetical protein UZ36_02470 [Candidatus Nitromaritima sp. SCGC AAA799-C22]
MNIRFEYLYRDAGNFKNWGEIVFTNPSGITVEIISSMAEKVLIDQTYFVANKANVPDLYFEVYNEQLDHGWHEVHTFQTTSEVQNDQYHRTIDEFVESLRDASAL